MSNVVFQGSGDFSSVEKAFQKMANENLKLLDQVQKLATAQNKAAATDKQNKSQQNALAKEAAALMERARTPLQKYNVELAKSKDHLAHERINSEAFRVEKQRLQTILQQEIASVTLLKGSYQQLEKELDDQVRKLKQLKIGTTEYDLQRQKVDQLRSSMRAAKAEITGQQKPLQENNEFLKSQLTSIASMAAGYLSVQAVLQAINAELEKKSRIEKGDAQITQDLDTAVAKAMPNIAPKDRGRFREMVRTEAHRLGVDQNKYANASGLAISAGAGDLDRAKVILEDLFTTTAGDAESANALGGAALDLTTLAGNDNIKGAIGQMAATMQKARATDMVTYFKALAPAIAATTAGGQNVDALSIERSLEVANTINQILKDTEGDKTSTALNQLNTKMDEFVPEAGKGISKGDVAAFTASRDFDERTNMLRKNPAMAKQFAGGLKTGKLKNALVEFVQGTDRLMALEADISAAIPSMEDAVPDFENLQSSVVKETAIKRADNRRLSVEQFHAGTTDSPFIGEGKKIFESALDGVDLAGFDNMPILGQKNKLQNVLGARQAMGEDPLQVMIELLERQPRTGGFLGSTMSAADTVKINDHVKNLKQLKNERDAAAPQAWPVQHVPEPRKAEPDFAPLNNKAATANQAEVLKELQTIARNSDGTYTATRDGVLMNKAVGRYRNQGEGGI